jgi:nudix-type nucleoside diphosphatase (YffH/AdpP family)
MTDAILSRRTVYKGWLSLVMVRLRLGGVECERAIVDHVSGASVLPYDPDRRVAMITRQTRDAVLFLDHPVFPESVSGVTEDELPAETARREAFEEVGLQLGELEAIGTVWMTPSSTTERVHLYLGRYSPADRTGSGGGVDDEIEHIEFREVPLAELWSDVERGLMTDAKLLLLLQALRIRHPELFDPARIAA